MKKIYNKYFDFIGIKNEGYKRIVIVTILLSMFIFPRFSDELSIYDFDDFFRYLFFDDSLEDVVLFYIWFLFLSPIVIGLIIKTYKWIKEGFNK